MTEPAAGNDGPHLTLVVPCYNGEDRLPASLELLAAFVHFC